MKDLLRMLLERLAPAAEREQRMATIAAIVGPSGVDEALDVAIEAAKLGLRVEDLQPMVSAWHDLRTLELIRPPHRGFVAWAIQHGFATQRQFEAAQALDLLAMREPEPTDEHDEIGQHQ